MRILKEVKGSVLWLLEDNASATRNLRAEAEKRGVSGERLVFAKFTSHADHLARHRVADLFLDTLPYNAHTTASDALWAELPVLTCTGQSFTSRVAASLLKAIDLPELITASATDYEHLAIELATQSDKLLAIKQKLASKRMTAPLFDAPRYTRNLEAAYSTMYERYQSHLPPDHIVIAKM
jgi:predicted O-linked N-acetylglucosamine transferase (SPINDLY family)